MYYPSEAEFIELARTGDLIPVTHQLLADYDTPVSAYEKIRGEGGSFLFESVEGGEHLGRYSFVGSNPRATIYQKGSHVEVVERGTVGERYCVGPPESPSSTNRVRDGLEVVERVLNRFRFVPLKDLPHRFTGGAVGYIGHEFIHDIEPVVPRPSKDELETPTFVFLLADELLAFDRVSQTITIVVNALIGPRQDPARAYAEAVSRIRRLIRKLEAPCQYRPAPFVKSDPPFNLRSNMSRQAFLEKVAKAKAYITAGDIIQVVGSQRFSRSIHATPLEVYRAARSINPSPYMFLLELEDLSLVGASPEIHVRCEDRHVELRPIAGTRPRGQTPEADRANERDLLADPKERAEHVMLVDLARNDIGRVCDFGSVEVKELMRIERYSHVMHIVSRVEGTLSEGRTPYDLMRATFPAGTLSGAPKIRAMQIIAELEQTQRGPYGGCVGYFSFNGNLDCCITIRTAVIKDGTAFVQAGGGWVADSVPETEYQETVNKAKAMVRAIELAERFAAST